MSKSIIRRLCPKNNIGDSVFSWYRFVESQRRLPRKTGELINDRLYRMKVDGTLLDPLRQFVSDKEFVKIYIAGTVGDEYNVGTYDILRRSSEIDGYRPSRFPCVVKPTHLSGPVKICLTAEDFPRSELLKSWVSRSHYQRTREQNYKRLQPKIIVEEFLSSDGTSSPDDYKVYCFYGIPKFIHVDADRFDNHTRNFYDIEWRHLDVEWAYPRRPLADPRPEALSEMLRFASALSTPFDFIRIDLYVVGKQVRVGELTNCPDGVNGVIKPKRMENELYHW